jgi:hypothetical protein
MADRSRIMIVPVGRFWRIFLELWIATGSLGLFRHHFHLSGWFECRQKSDSCVLSRSSVLLRKPALRQPPIRGGPSNSRTLAERVKHAALKLAVSSISSIASVSSVWQNEVVAKQVRGSREHRNPPVGLRHTARRVAHRWAYATPLAGLSRNKSERKP